MNTAPIISTCQEHGLAIDDVRLTEGLLELTPSDPDNLPAAADLQTLAALLKGADVRWVTLVISEDV